MGEPSVDLVFQPVDPLVQAVEPGGGLHAEGVDRLAVGVDLHSEVGQVSVARGGEVASRRRVGRHLLDTHLERGDPRLQVW